jgi:hypothetical protein
MCVVVVKRTASQSILGVAQVHNAATAPAANPIANRQRFISITTVIKAHRAAKTWSGSIPVSSIWATFGPQIFERLRACDFAARQSSEVERDEPRSATSLQALPSRTRV